MYGKFELLRATDVKGGPSRQHDDNRGPNKHSVWKILKEKVKMDIKLNQKKRKLL